MTTPTTRKYPRTLQEAFGPYTDHIIHEPEIETDIDLQVGAFCIAAAAVVGLLCYFGVIV